MERNPREDAKPEASGLTMRTFECKCCGIEINYEYKGRTPPYEPSIIFLEDGYFRRDPFADVKRPLFIGADCNVCSRPVCAQPTCSLFFTKRFCAACAKQYAEGFPLELRPDLEKLQAMPVAPATFDVDYGEIRTSS